MIDKACFKKSVVHDFVWICGIIVILFFICVGYFGTNALIPYLTPYGTAYNWAIISSVIAMLIFLLIPLLISPYDAKELPTGVLLIINYMINIFIFIMYNSSACSYTYAYVRVCKEFPDISLFMIGIMIVFTIIHPLNMGYARCRVNT